MINRREKRAATADHAGYAPFLYKYISVRNQVNGFTSFQARTGESRWRPHVEPKSKAGRNGLRFHASCDAERELVHDLFYGIEENPTKCELWYLMCYRVMRDRGIWPVNIAAEQRLADELYLPCTGVPNTPAAIQ
jgi:hypothetical protein